MPAPNPQNGITQVQGEAIRCLGLDEAYAETAREIQAVTNNPYLGSYAVGKGSGEVTVHALRSHSGPTVDAYGNTLVAKGGLRRVYDPSPDMNAYIREIERLSPIMLHKVAILGRNRPMQRLDLPVPTRRVGLRGGKGEQVVEASRDLPPELQEEAMYRYYDLMHERGYTDAFVDVPAGDVNISTPHLDFYAARHAELNPNDPLANAVITGTSERFGGKQAKGRTTGLGLWVSHNEMNAHFNGELRTSAIQGFGAVGAYYALFASRDPEIRIQAISDKEGMLYTDDSAGMHITESMVQEVLVTPPGQKLARLRTMLQHDQGNLQLDLKASEAIYDFGADVFNPCALGGGTDPVNADRLYRAGTRYVNEGANEPTTPMGHSVLTVAGVTVMPDIAANIGGVEGSAIQYEDARYLQEHPDAEPVTDEQLLEGVDAASRESVQKVLYVADLFDTDLRTAAVAISTGRLFVAHGTVSADSDIARLVAA